MPHEEAECVLVPGTSVCPTVQGNTALSKGTRREPLLITTERPRCCLRKSLEFAGLDRRSVASRLAVVREEVG